MFTHPYIASQLNSQRIARFHVEAAADRGVRQARAARRRSRATTTTHRPRPIWFLRSAVAAVYPAV
jgi:hypothetical protein